MTYQLLAFLTRQFQSFHILVRFVEYRGVEDSSIFVDFFLRLLPCQNKKVEKKKKYFHEEIFSLLCRLKIQSSNPLTYVKRYLV